MTRTATISETALQAHVVKLLQAYARPDVLWLHCPNGELRNHKVGSKLKLAGVRAGASDLLLCVQGRFHALELKTEIGVLSPKQITFSEDLERAGGLFHVAFGLDQAIGVLQGLGVFRPGVRFSIPTQPNPDAPNGRGVRKGELASAAGSPNPLSIKCAACGRFIPHNELRNGKARLHFEPSSHFGPELSEWECAQCVIKFPNNQSTRADAAPA